ncbi:MULTISPECIES: hypothetical protein [Prevotella]|jgi:hypothetical protein|uniref:Uncharacterized protein n=1 Tax=Prevotella lacticifex TaxID=2854755 RepID=A0A9R1C907_9BACT|nr:MULTISPECIES: hypothetical protein [Prevotella]MDD6853745.1 hypothetical protein [Prevotella sp.]GJG37433.1 hypothetical protein PRLR5003_25900 [Prevotella lacticifex]GJG40616.1 hypothetical protein PRLR5019_25870 [Prevotella lacticifex]GJG44312.1 hypothetical protein PRLR5025_30980 [Prevotella lacticifex]GJG46998.1 hypothetical protein PRLR5027_25930 [Prevotella lacticifex]
MNGMKIFWKTFLYMFGMGNNPMSIDEHSDSEAIKHDWENVGRDLFAAMNNYGRK